GSRPARGPLRCDVTLQQWIALKQKDTRRPSGAQLRNVTPSVRDFTQAVSTRRDGTLSVIAEIVSKDPDEGLLDPQPDVQTLAGAAVRAGVAAIAIATDPHALGGSEEWMSHGDAPTSTPILERDLILTADQLYRARLRGADAAWLLCAALHPSELKR